MALSHGVSVLLTLLLGPLLGTLAWGYWRSRRDEPASGLLASRDDLLLVFLLLAAVGFGAFLVFLLLAVAE